MGLRPWVFARGLFIFRPGRSGAETLKVLNLSKSYADRPILRNVSFLVSPGERAGLVGPNGAGKTTLVHAITGQLPPLAGRLWLGASVRLGYFTKEHDRLDPALNALETLQQFSAQNDTDLRSFLHYFLFEGDEVFTPVGELSFGERARLMLATLVAQGCNFLVLDEPITTSISPRASASSRR
jgi:ATP-binding cassette subfamily F protein 3